MLGGGSDVNSLARFIPDFAALPAAGDPLLAAGEFVAILVPAVWSRIIALDDMYVSYYRSA